MKRFVVVLALVALAGRCQGQVKSLDPCDPTNYNELNEPYRSTGFETAYPEKPLCDLHLPEGWYRFNSAAGGMMPTTCPDRLKCGTVVPIWLKGTHPSVADGVVMREACGNFDSGSPGADHCCEHKVTIGVKNCGHFYVYYLTPTPSCPVSYCAGTLSPCPIGKWSPNMMPPCRDAFPVMKNPPKLTGPNVHGNTSFDFGCEIDYAPQDPDQIFEVVWTFDGKEDPMIPPQIVKDPQRTVTLDGKFLRNHVNTNIKCRVRAYYKGNQAHKSAFLHSNSYYAGIQISPAKLIVSEKDFTENVEITSTIPIVCDHGLQCCLTFKLDVDATSDVSVQNMCDYSMCSEDWDPQTRSATIRVPVIANQDMVKDGDTHLMLSFEELLPAGGGDYLDVFNNHKVNSLPIEVKDTQTSSCIMTGDPHIHGFDFSTYHLFKTGDFTAYEVPSRDFQVQIRTWACGRVACICGVTIREKNDVIRIDECDQSPRGAHTSPTVDIANQLREGTIIQRSRNGKRIGVYLPSGSEIRIDATNYYFNLYITTPGTDRRMARGLCGTNDGHKGNEFTHPDGTQDPICDPSKACIPNSFEEAWRSAPQNSLFETVPNPIQVTHEVKYCACKDNYNGSPIINCTVRANVPTTGTACPSTCRAITPSLKPSFINNQWHKRAVTFDDIDIPDAPYVQKDLPPIDFNKQWPNDQGVTEAQARDMCTKAVHKSPLHAKCGVSGDMTQHAMTDCMADILYGGSTEFLDAITSAFTTQCQLTLAQDPASYVTDVNGNRVMKHEYLDDICDMECEEHGHCGNHGTCICDNGWEGVNCHIESGKGPQMDKIRSGPLCDKSQRPCKRVFIDVSNIDLSDELTCLVQPVDDQGNNVGKPFEAEADFLSAHRIACQLPETKTATQQYKISATNDGHVYGNQLSINVFDSTCMDCTGAGCKPKTSACHIDNVCYRDGDTAKDDVTKVCAVTTDTAAWTILSTTATPHLAFYPTLSGPDVDNLMSCKFSPPADATGDFTVTWYVDDVKRVSETLPQGVSEAMLSALDLPSTGTLTCKVEQNGSVSESGSFNLANLKH